MASYPRAMKLKVLPGVLALLSCFGIPLQAAQPARERLFNEDWRFVRGEVAGGDKANCKDDSWRKLTLPHDWSIEGDFSEEFASCTGYLAGGTGWYRKHFKLPVTSVGMRIYVRFEGVYRNSDVWLNGRHLGSRPNGYIDFEYDLTPHLVPAGGDNVIAVKVAREQVADSRWYPGSGIYRDVWLTMVDPVHVVRHGTFVTTPVVTDEEAMVNSVCEVANESVKESEVTMTALVCDTDGHTVSSASSRQVVAAGASWNFALFHPVGKPRRWSHEDPYLYQVIHRVEVAGRVVDEVTTSLGIRTCRFDANHGFFLNEKPMLIKGVCNHHDAGNFGAVMPRAVLERRLRILKDIGVNAIRCSHNPMQDNLYDLCDRMGFLVMDEAFDEWEIGKRKWVKGRNVGTATRFGYNEAFKEWAVRDVEAMVKRSRQHPSVILYSIGNEIDYPTDPYVHSHSTKVEIFKDDPALPSMNRLAAVAPSLIAAVKRMDPTRPVTMALSNVGATNAIGLASMLDVAGYNYQESFYDADHKSFPARIILGSENSGAVVAWHAVTHKPFISGQFLWTGFDFLGEASSWPSHGSHAGLFDTAGFIKPGGLLREALWSDTPVLHLAVYQSNFRKPRMHWNKIADESGPVSVVAYSNLPEVTLELNGTVIGSARPEDGIARWSVPWQAGRLLVSGKSADGKTLTDQLQSTGPATRIRLTTDRSRLLNDGRDAVHITIELLDEAGLPVTGDDRRVTVSTTNPARLAALENGDQEDNTPAKSPSRKTRAGKALAVIQASGTGAIPVVTVSADGLTASEIRLDLASDGSH